MKKLGYILFVLLFMTILTMQGCNERSVAMNQQEDPSPPTDEIPLNTIDEKDISENENATNIFYPFEKYQWTEDGNLVIQYQDTLTWITSDGIKNQTIEFPLPEEYAEQTLIVGSSYIFAIYYEAPNEVFPQPMPVARVINQDGEYSLINCAVYDMQGNLLHKFPTAMGDDLKQNYLYMERKYAYYNFERVEWLDNTHFVINDTARIFIYDLETDKLTLACDYTDDRIKGYTVGDSGVFATFTVGVDEEAFYFSAAHFDDDLEHAPRHFFKVDCLGNVVKLKREAYATNMKVGNGFTSFNKTWTDPIKNGEEGWYRATSDIEGEEHYVGRYCQGTYSELIHGKERISYHETHLLGNPLETNAEQNDLYSHAFVTINTSTNETVKIDPTKLDYSKLFGENKERYYYELIGVQAKDTVKFLFTLMWEEQMGQSDNGPLLQAFVNLCCYDVQEETVQLLKESSGSSFYINSQMTAAIEVDISGDKLQIIPLD